MLISQGLSLVRVPRGIPSSNGRWIKNATIRQITGYDEQDMSERSPDIPIHQRVLLLLERIVTFNDCKKTKTKQVLLQLSIGDRTTILFNARKMILGDIIQCTAKCIICNNKMSLDLSISDLLRAHNSYNHKEIYEFETGGYKIKIRPLNAFDQDKLIKRNTSILSAEAELVKSCIVNSIPVLPTIIPKSIVEILGSKMEDIDPLSDLTLNISCPECNKKFQILFPAEEFILRELLANSKNLEREIHWLAFHYGWDEDTILSLPSKKRRKYVELINATLTGENI